MGIYSCTRCKGKFNFREIQYDQNHKIVCKKCLGKVDDLRELHDTEFEEKQKVKYICMHCRFQFSKARNSRIAHKCPNCGRSQLMEVKKYKDTNDLIEEASNSKYDY